MFDEEKIGEYKVTFESVTYMLIETAYIESIDDLNERCAKQYTDDKERHVAFCADAVRESEWDAHLANVDGVEYYSVTWISRDIYEWSCFGAGCGACCECLDDYTEACNWDEPFSVEWGY